MQSIIDKTNGRLAGLDDTINRVNNWVDGGEDEELENSYHKWKADEIVFQEKYGHKDNTQVKSGSVKNDFYTNLSQKYPDEISKIMRDKEQYERYINILGKENVPNNLESFQNLKYNKLNTYKELQGVYRDVSW